MEQRFQNSERKLFPIQIPYLGKPSSKCEGRRRTLETCKLSKSSHISWCLNLTCFRKKSLNYRYKVGCASEYLLSLRKGIRTNWSHGGTHRALSFKISLENGPELLPDGSLAFPACPSHPWQLAATCTLSGAWGSASSRLNLPLPPCALSQEAMLQQN